MHTSAVRLLMGEVKDIKVRPKGWLRSEASSRAEGSSHEK